LLEDGALSDRLRVRGWLFEALDQKVARALAAPDLLAQPAGLTAAPRPSVPAVVRIAILRRDLSALSPSLGALWSRCDCARPDELTDLVAGIGRECDQLGAHDVDGAATGKRGLALFGGSDQRAQLARAKGGEVEFDVLSVGRGREAVKRSRL